MYCCRLEFIDQLERIQAWKTKTDNYFLSFGNKFFSGCKGLLLCDLEKQEGVRDWQKNGVGKVKGG